MSKGYRVLVVCLGNICRSPLAEAVLRQELRRAGLASKVTVDSAGTGDWHVGHGPDRRMVAAAKAAGIHLDGTARQIAAADLRDSDLILVMDRQNLADVQALAPDGATQAKVHLFLEFAGHGTRDVPDPYAGGPEGFDHVVSLVRDAARGVVTAVRENLQAA